MDERERKKIFFAPLVDNLDRLIILAIIFFSKKIWKNSGILVLYVYIYVYSDMDGVRYLQRLLRKQLVRHRGQYS